PMSTTAVFVTNIPDESLGEGSVREFFERFGAIQDLRIDANRHTAMIEYGDSSAQAQALSTPEAIFNNRFVRVHKARQQQQPQQQQQQHANGEAGGYQQRPPASASAAQPPVWRPKSATIKKAEMIERFVEQQKELMKKLTTIKDMPPATRKIIMDSINQIQKKIDDIRRPPAAGAAAAAAAAGAAAKAAITEDNTNDSVGGGPPSAAAESQPEQRTEVSAVEAEKQALQAKLKALQVEAARLGMARGGGNSRGRGGRGGGFASASSSHHGSMSLDKRPRTLVLRNVGQAAAERLDSEMAQFGEIEHIDKTEDRNDPPFTYAVKYKARWEAEAAMRAVTSIDAFSDVSADWEHMSINVSEPSTGSNGDSGGGLRPTIDPCAVLSTLDTSPGEVVIGGSSACFTVTGLKVTSTRDAMMIFEACRQGILPRVVRRLQDNEKKQIDAGTIVVFDEREAKMKRWTDGRLWTPSRIVNNFLLYRELQEKIQPGQEGAAEVNRWTRNTRSRRPGSYGSSKGVFVPKEHGLIKRTISLSVPDNEAEYLQSQGPWRAPSRVHQQHLISYSYAEGEAQLPAPDDMEELQYLRLPLQLLRIQKFRRPVHITFVDEPSNYDMVETDEEDGDETTAANTGDNNAQRTTTGSGHSRRVYGAVADTLSLPSSELSASLPLSSPIHQPQIDPLGMQPPTT
ncbi:Global transcription regulator sge1, partial [Coemansia sp. RSA 2681]